MGTSSSKQHTPECLSLEKLKSLDALSIHRVEAEYVYRAMHRGWYGYGQRGNYVYDTPPPASPLYGSGDDEPAEPSSVINALAVTVPPIGSRQHQSVTSSSSHSSSSMHRTRSAGLCPTADQLYILQAAAVPHPHELLARTASATAALAAAAAAAASAGTASSSSSGVLRRSSSGSSNSSSGSGSSRHGRSSRSSRRTAEDVLQHAAVLPGSKAVRFAGAHRTAGGTLQLPLSSAALTAANGNGAPLAHQDLSLVTSRASNVDADLRPLHHLHLMQQRRHTQHHATHHQHHKQRQQQQHVGTCAHLQVHSDGWYLAPMGKLAEIAAS